MKRVVLSLTHPILVLTALMLSIAAFTQPVPSLHAQAPAVPPTPTSSTTSTEARPSSQSSVALVNAAGESPVAPSEDVATQIRAQQQPKSAPAPVITDNGATAEPSSVGPQATLLTPFVINVVSNSSARADTDLTYTIYFTNTSPSITYQNVLLQDGIGNGQFYSGCSDTTTCSFTYTGDLVRPTLFSVTGRPDDSSSRQIVWSLGNVTPGQKGRISYTVRVRFDLFPQSDHPSQVLGNTVALYKDGAISSNNKLNEDQWGVLVAGPIFYLTKSGTPLQLLEGDQIDYVIAVGNATGPNDQSRVDGQPATQVLVLDILPLQLENVQARDGGSYDPNTRWVTWHLTGTLALHEMRWLHFSATIKNDLAYCAGMTNRDFFATSLEMPYDSNLNHYPIRGQIDTTSYIVPPATVSVLPVPGGVKVGEAVTWTIDAKNYWKTAISGASVKFTLPPDFIYDGSNPPGTYDNLSKTVTWSNLTLPLKASFTNPGFLEFTVQSRAGRKIDRNDGIAEITLPASVPSGCLRAVYNSVGVEPLIYVVKTVNPTTAVLAGTDVVYTVDLYNISGQAMTGVSLDDYLPVPHGRSFVYKNMVSGPAPSSVGAPSPSARQVVRWDGLAIPSGTQANPGKFTLRFTATVDGVPQDCEDNLAQPDAPISQGRLVGGGRVCIDFPWIVQKTSDRSSVAPRDTNRRLQFTLKFISQVNTPQLITPRDFMASDDPRYYFRFVGMISGPNPLNTIPDQGRITWPEVTLGARQTITYVYQVDLPEQDGVIPAGLYCNQGELWPEPNEQFLYIVKSNACITVSSINLHVYKAIDRSVAGLGELVTYNIVLENQSNDAVGGLTISDTLPVNMSYAGAVTGSPAPAITTLANGQQRLTWNSLAVSGATTKPVAYKVRAPALINSTVLNVAEVSGGTPVPNFICDNDPAPGDGRCLTSINLDVRNLITIEPSVAPAVTDPGSVVTYTISLVSNNNIPYQNVIVTDTLPIGVMFLDTVTGAEPTQVRPGVLVWRNQTVPAQSGPTAGRLTFVFTARVPLGYGSLRSRIEATSTTGVIPTADNVGRVLIAPLNAALSLFATPLVQSGGDVTLKISLVNPEATDLTNVVVSELLPDGFSYVNGTASLNPTSVSGQTLMWSGLTIPAANSDGPGIIEITFHATAPVTLGTYTSTVTATGSRAIDQTYNTAQIIVAQLTYLYLPLIMEQYTPPPVTSLSAPGVHPND
jgi:uncharacterized repeat protein (TIGR01451 family)